MGRGGGAGQETKCPGDQAAGWDNPQHPFGWEGQQQVAQGNPGYVLVTSSPDSQAGMWPGSPIP